MDIDIDVKDRSAFLKDFEHINALNTDGKSKHVVGVYFQDIPYNILTDTASIDFKEADSLGYFKVDVLNNNVYNMVESREHLDQILSEDIDWTILEDREKVENLPHIHGHFDIVEKIKPVSIEDLAIVLALIRPAKRYLIDKKIEKIREEIWKEGEGYHFKKSHSVAYAMMITVAMRLL